MDGQERKGGAYLAYGVCNVDYWHQDGGVLMYLRLRAKGSNVSLDGRQLLRARYDTQKHRFIEHTDLKAKY